MFENEIVKGCLENRSFLPEWTFSAGLSRGLLIGNPVDKSISHITHNRIFQTLGINAIYEKKLINIEVFEDELKSLLRKDYLWIAVTMPFKEKIIPFLDQLDISAELIGAVNMIHNVEGKWVGYNTDGSGCLNAIESKRRVKDKIVVVLGAGGAAKAIIYEAKRRGANVIVLNRTFEKAKLLAKRFNADVSKMLPSEYDILINATSVGMLGQKNNSCFSLDDISPSALVMDVIYSPRVTKLISHAQSRGCETVLGSEMFAELTFLQLQQVFGKQVSKEICSKIISQSL